MRIRQIKPEFWSDPDLLELSRDERLLFIGLWALADCEGRLRDHPKFIKSQIFPYDDDLTDVIVDHMLENISTLHGDPIIRYEIDGKKIIQIKNFKKHQRLSGNEASSTSKYPAYKVKNKNGSKREALGKQCGSHHTEDRKYGLTEIRNDGMTEETDPKPEPTPKKATRISENWQPDEDLLAWAEETYPDGDIPHETALFVDHFVGNGERRLSWVASYRNWIRRAHKWGGKSRARAPTKDQIQQRHDRVAKRETFESGVYDL